MIIEPSPLTTLVENMEAAIGQDDWGAAASFFTSDVKYTVGCRDPVIGVDGIRQYMAWQTQHVRWEGHTIHMMFSRDGTAIFEVTSHFIRLADQTKINLPCTDIYRFRDNRIADWRVYADTRMFDP